LLEAFIAALGSNFDVNIIRYPDNASWGYAELETYAREALPETGPFFILGESFSGPLAVMIASALPDRVQGLILCGSFVRNPRPALSWLAPFIRLLPVSRAPASALGYLLFDTHASAEIRPAFSDTLAQISPATLRTRLRAVMEVDVSAKFTALRLPVLYLRAAHDRTVPLAASDLVLRLNPRTVSVQIEAPHFMLQAAPEESARAVRHFVEGVRHEK
jgi:pimeloyl-ACP methyl ester carboxylesterase